MKPENTEGNRLTAIVTGASSGIALGITRALLASGYRVVGTARSIDESKQLKASADLVLVDGDIGRKDTTVKITEAALRHFDRIDLLVNRGRRRLCARRRPDGEVAAFGRTQPRPRNSDLAGTTSAETWPNANGYVNRTLPDAELDPFVEALATRIASFDRQVIIKIKQLVNIASLPPESEMQPEWDALIGSVSGSSAQARLTFLIDKGLQTPGDVEEHLGRHTAEYMK